jgi:hypothetical protein
MQSTYIAHFIIGNLYAKTTLHPVPSKHSFYVYIMKIQNIFTSDFVKQTNILENGF